jgi:hypothetical protein
LVTTAVVGPGFLLDYENPDTPGDWIHVGQVRDIDGPSESTEEFDITNQDSEGGFRELVATLQDGGTVSFDVVGNPDDTGQQGFVALKHARTTVNWRIQHPENADGEVWGQFFPGFVNQLGNARTLAGAWIRNCQIRVVGPVVEDIISS